MNICNSDDANYLYQLCFYFFKFGNWFWKSYQGMSYCRKGQSTTWYCTRAQEPQVSVGFCSVSYYSTCTYVVFKDIYAYCMFYLEIAAHCGQWNYSRIFKARDLYSLYIFSFKIICCPQSAAHGRTHLYDLHREQEDNRKNKAWNTTIIKLQSFLYMRRSRPWSEIFWLEEGSRVDKFV